MELSPCSRIAENGEKMGLLTDTEIREINLEGLDVCFTGSRKGLTDFQRVTLQRWMETKPDTVRHGDCVGADTVFHDICLSLGYDESNLTLHPGTSEKYRAFNEGGLIVETKQNHHRNRLMVMLSEVVIACPYVDIFDDKSGTWYTINYAQSRAVRTLVIFPYGKVAEKK